MAKRFKFNPKKKKKKETSENTNSSIPVISNVPNNVTNSVSPKKNDDLQNKVIKENTSPKVEPSKNEKEEILETYNIPANNEKEESTEVFDAKDLDIKNETVKTNIENKKTEKKKPKKKENKKPRINPSSPEALFKKTGVPSSPAITGAISSYNPSSPEALFRKQNEEMQQSLQEELKKQKNKSNYNTNDLIMKFIYSNYDIVGTKRFNPYAFIFGPLYFFYRKVYFYGLITFLVEAYAFFTQIQESNYMFLIIIHLLIGLICGIFFNGLYLKFVKSSVLEIEKNAKNQKEAEKTCKLKGGVSTSAPLIPVVIALLFFGLIVGVFNKKDGSVESGYAVNIESNIEEYISNNEKYLVKMPTSDANFACYRENENDTWKLKEGYTLTTGDCATFMNSISNTTGSLHFNHLKSATVVITPNGMVTNGTILEIDNFTCTFLSPGQFDCKKGLNK